MYQLSNTNTVAMDTVAMDCVLTKRYIPDPGNIMLADNIRQNSKYLARLLTCRVKSAPTGLLHPTMLVNGLIYRVITGYYPN